MWPFRRVETPPDRHDTVLELIEQVAQLRGQVRTLESEWAETHVRLRKAYQRIEKANERAEKREAGEELEPEQPALGLDGARGFARKLQSMRGG